MLSLLENVLSPNPGLSRQVHLIRNGLLVLLSLICLPFSTLVLLASLLITLPARMFRRPATGGRVVLVTGVGMSKGLQVARLLHQAGCQVIGADFEPDGIYVAGRFSQALSRFYQLEDPQSKRNGVQSYINQLVEIVDTHKVDLWISCSGVATAEGDGLAKDAIEERTTCTAIQFGQKVIEALHNKDSFSNLAEKFDLSGPQAAVITSCEDAMAYLERVEKPETYLMKSVALDDVSRNERRLLPFASKEATRGYLKSLDISSENRWQLQRFILGKEYCTHALVHRGEVLAFTACPSQDLLMHYQSMSPEDPLFQSMLQWTRTFVSRFDTGGEMTGHLSFDFLVETSWDHRGFRSDILPIECNPRVHTNVLLFQNDSGLQQAYLAPLNKNVVAKVAAPPIHMTPTIRGCYWIGHDLGELVLVPLLRLIVSPRSVGDFGRSVTSFLHHLVYWKEGIFLWSDPVPWFWLYHGYWPAVFLSCMLKDRKWTRVNVSTGKVFRC